MRIGYCRVSTDDQNLDMQVEALKRAKCNRLVKEVISGKSDDRAVLEKLVAPLKSGDTLVVWRVDRLGRSFFPLVELEDRLTRRGVNIVSAIEGVDTATKTGRLTYWLLAIFAHQEHDGIITRTLAGVATARAAGKQFGRKPKLSEGKLRRALKQLDRGDAPVEVAERFGVCRATLYRYRAERNAKHTSSAADV
jgi:DNA invertase Pin-like site-specific DNA recombinase